MKDRHVVEAMGKAYVVIEDGRAVEAGEPLIERCPIFAKAPGIEEISQETIKQNIEFRIRDFGVCAGERAIGMKVFVGFGASEVMMTELTRDLIDANVPVCDGVGTFITPNLSLTQGLAARISSVTEMTLFPNLKNRVEEKGGILLDGKNAIINQLLGVGRAMKIVFERVAVTVATLSEAQQCRSIERETGAATVIIGVHVSGIEQDAASDFVYPMDVTRACASCVIRETVSKHALAQVGTAVPPFALSQKGKELLLERAKEVTTPILINTMKLQVLPEVKQPRPLT